jgi:hypothetical protein
MRKNCGEDISRANGEYLLRSIRGNICAATVVEDAYPQRTALDQNDFRTMLVPQRTSDCLDFAPTSHGSTLTLIGHNRKLFRDASVLSEWLRVIR